MPDFDMPLEGSWEERGGWVVRQLAADLSLTPEQAAGLVGNLGYESRGFETLQEMQPMVRGSRGGYGYAQWTGSRRVNFENWCASHVLAPSSDEANYGFLVHELTGAYKGFADRLRKTATIEEASRLTHKEYETPADVLDGSYRSGLARLDWARRALNGSMGAPPPAVQAGDPSPGMVVPPVSENPVELIKAAQRIIGAVPDGIPGDETRRKLRLWVNTHPEGD